MPGNFSVKFEKRHNNALTSNLYIHSEIFAETKNLCFIIYTKQYAYTYYICEICKRNIKRNLFI